MILSWTRRHLTTLVIVLLAYVPLLLSAPGSLSADTKSHLYTDPGLLLSRASSMWDPNTALGTVTHQTISYLFPIGPWYWFFEVIGSPDWVAQRLWMGTMIVAAGLGARALGRALGLDAMGAMLAGLVYMFSPYALAYGARLSVIALPWCAVPWLVLFARRSVLRGGWRDPAWFAFVILFVGSANLTSLVLAGLAPIVWVIALAVRRMATVGATVAACLRMGVLSIAVSIWWLVALVVQSIYGLDILEYTEPAEIVADHSLASEVWRGMGYWFMYGDDRLGQWVEAGRALVQNPVVIAASFIIPVIGLTGLVLVRWRPRATIIAMTLTGLVFAVGAHPWDSPTPLGRIMKAVLETPTGLAMRSLPRAAPLVVLGVALGAGALITALGRHRAAWQRPAGAALGVVVLVAAASGLGDGWIDDNLSRPEELPEYWIEAADYLDATDDGTRVLETPGIEFASYRWGSTVDPFLSGLIERPVAYRELIPWGSEPSTNLLLAWDRRLQQMTMEPASVASMARVMRSGTYLLRNDLQFERYRTPRPQVFAPYIANVPGLGEPTDFGVGVPNETDPDVPMLDDQELALDPAATDPPALQAFPVEGARTIIDRVSTGRPIIMTGDGDGIVDATGAGLLSGNETIFYSGAQYGENDILDDLLADGAGLILTDSNRQRAYRWTGVMENAGFTEEVGIAPLEFDSFDNRMTLFPDAPLTESTLVAARGGIRARASSYGNSVSYNPEYRPTSAIDGLLSTAWLTAPGADPLGERIRLELDEPVTTDTITVVQKHTGSERYLAQIELRLDGGAPMLVDLDARSLDAPGQRITFPTQTFSQAEIEVVSASERFGNPVGFAEIDIDGLTTDEVVIMPPALLREVGDASLDHPLAVVMTRLRANPADATRRDEERSLSREFETPADRSFAVAGVARLSINAPDDLIDRVLGFPSAEEGGVTARSSSRLHGDLHSRASSAIDGALDTAWTPLFDVIEGDWIELTTADPVTVEQFDLTLIADGRHSVPTQLLLENELGETRTVELPPIADQTSPNATVTVPVEIPALAAQTLRVTVTEVREVLTTDWFSKDDKPTPFAIAELGIDGVSLAAGPGTIDASCRSDLLSVDGRPVPVRLVGDAEAALDHGGIDVEPCAPSDVVDVDSGTVQVRTTTGELTGFELDQVVLTSAAGGAAAALDLADAVPVDLTVTDDGRTRIEAVAAPSSTDSWLLLGESWNAGWRATVDGVDMGPPQLINGFANGWRLAPSDTEQTVVIEWVPQRAVDIGLLASALLAPAVVLLALLGRRRPVGSGELVAAPELALERLTSRGRLELPPRRTVLLALLVCGIGVLLAGPIPALIAFVVAVAASILPRGRMLLTLAVPGLMALVGLDIVQLQWRYALRAGFTWLGWFDRADVLALTTAVLLVVHLVVDDAVERWRGDTGHGDTEHTEPERDEAQG